MSSRSNEPGYRALVAVSAGGFIKDGLWPRGRLEQRGLRDDDRLATRHRREPRRQRIKCPSEELRSRGINHLRRAEYLRIYRRRTQPVPQFVTESRTHKPVPQAQPS